MQSNQLINAKDLFAALQWLSVNKIHVHAFKCVKDEVVILVEPDEILSDELNGCKLIQQKTNELQSKRNQDG